MTSEALLLARRRFLIHTGLLDTEWYVAHQPAAAGAADPVAHYLEHGAPGGLAPNPELAALQAAGLRTGGGDASTGLRRVPAPDDPALLQEAELVRASGLFDPDFYLEQKPELRKSAGTDLVLHFCRTGWRNLLRPFRGFDTWWYWMNHLDPGVEAMNPFVHYLLVGMAAGHTPLPLGVVERAPWPPPEPGPRRVCLFAGFDRDGLVDDYVVDYVRELSRFADVYYLADSYVDPAELDRLAPYTCGAWGVRHGAYDFGSWSMLARDLVGWDRIDTYDELLLVNDSCYLLRPLDEVFTQMDATACDWWGLQATKGISATADRSRRLLDAPVPMEVVRERLLEGFDREAPYDFHVGSYFLAFRAPVLRDGHLRRLLDSVHDQRDKLLVVVKYEAGLTHYLLGNGYRMRTFVDALHPFHPLFTDTAFTLVERGFPLLKKYLLYQNHYDVPDLHDWKRRVLELVPDAPVDTFEANLLRTAPDDALARSFAVRTQPDGSVRVPVLAKGPAFRRQGRSTPVDPDRWAFVAWGADGRLPPSSRALFEEVRQDPSVTKVVLSRTRHVELTGANVRVVPLASEEGRDQLLRSGRLVVVGDPRLELNRLPLDWDRHQPVVVRGGLALTRHGRALEPPTAPPREVPRRVVRGLLCSSDLDRLVALAAEAPTDWDSCWQTGLPTTDLLLRDRDRLPDDVGDQEDRLRADLAGRRLVLLSPEWRRSRPSGVHELSAEELSWLDDWCARNDVVIGLREDPRDLGRPYMRRLHGHVLDLSVRHFPDAWPLMRCADALWTDTDGRALEFLATGRPVLSFVRDLPDLEGSTYYGLDHVLPGPVCRTFEELRAGLEGLLEEPDETQRHRYRRSQRLFFDHLDDGASRRVVERIRALEEPA